MQIDAIFDTQFNPDRLQDLGTRGDALIRLLGMVPPIHVDLLGRDGTPIAQFLLGNREIEFRCSIEKAWSVSRSGVKLLLNDAAGRCAEVFLIVGGSTRVQ